MLKIKRQDVARAIKRWCCLLGMLLVLIGIAGNLLGDPKTLMYFAFYFIFVFFVIYLMLERVVVLRILIAIINLVTNDKQQGGFDTSTEIFPSMIEDSAIEQLKHHGNDRVWERDGRQVSLLSRHIMLISNPPIIFFIKKANLIVLNKAILYVRHNEITLNLRVVHIYPEETPAALANVNALKEMVALYDQVYPKLRTDFYSIRGAFEPAMIEWISHKYGIKANMM
ncbi:hypothetical protein AeMF1_020628 [Aphanomyces euteiches]|nr:hypothetical protein AeMF1_020628 [Aphanomyces euteiches]KAH9190737.1 hypothetical protein AeNC1_007287 [Aphanomyces euteiches]